MGPVTPALVAVGLRVPTWPLTDESLGKQLGGLQGLRLQIGVALKGGFLILALPK